MSVWCELHYLKVINTFLRNDPRGSSRLPPTVDARVFSWMRQFLLRLVRKRQTSRLSVRVVCVVGTIRGAGWTRAGGEGGGAQASVPFRVASTRQECPSPTRTDHVPDAAALFLTRLGGSVRRWRLQPLPLVPGTGPRPSVRSDRDPAASMGV